jgi:hypothetical protein
MDSVIHEIAWLLSARYLVSDVRSRPSTVRTDYVMKVGFSATVGEGPEKELTCVCCSQFKRKMRCASAPNWATAPTLCDSSG